MNDIRAKAEEWNAGSTKKVPYEFVDPARAREA